MHYLGFISLLLDSMMGGGGRGGSLTNEKCVGASGDAKSVGDKMLVL